MNNQTEESNASIQPDIEIYVKELNPNELTHWLQLHFEVESSNLEKISRELEKMTEISVVYDKNTIELMITPKAAGKRYTSLWFKSIHTPWNSDKECALDYLKYADGEVRCSAGGWTESEEEFSEEWLSLTRETEKRILWG